MIKQLVSTLILVMVPTIAMAGATKFYVPLSRSEVVVSPKDLSEVIVADPDVADVFVHGKNTVSVIGKRLGQTSVKFFDEDSKLVREMDVYVTYDLPAIRKALNEFLPYEQISVEMINTRVALTGEVSSAEAASSALEIASQFVFPSAAPSEVYQNVATQDGQQQLAGTVMNLMRVRSGQQVMLRIRFGEVTRSTIKALGSGLSVLRSGGDLAFEVFSASGVSGVSSSTAATLRSLTGQYAVSDSTSVTATLEALERDNLIKILAEPNLVTVSGEEAEFLSGGEVPIPVAQDEDTISVEYRPFGVSLRFTPYVLSENRIRIQVQPEVSIRNDAEGVSIGTSTTVVPSFDVRRASTTVELAPGESFMIAGLLEDTLDTSVDQLPGISEIPIFSSLFRTSDYSRSETELVIAVTPYLIDPLQSSDVRLPTDDFRPPSFMDSFLYGALGSIQGNVRRTSQIPTMEGPVGFMVD